MTKLILLRHGQSEWNKKNLCTGWINSPLSPEGTAEALKLKLQLAQEKIDIVFVSSLIRAQQTALLSLSDTDKTPILISQNNNNPSWSKLPSNNTQWHDSIPMIEDSRLNERYYGDLQGMNKTTAIDKYGADQVKIWRRSFDTPPPNGESLAMTSKRTIPALKELIIPQLEQQKNVLVVAHGNSLRSIIMHIENTAAKDIDKLEIATAIPIYYQYKLQQFTKISR